MGAGGVVPDTGIGIVGVYAESQHLSGTLVGDFLVVEVDAHAESFTMNPVIHCPSFSGTKTSPGNFFLNLSWVSK